MNEVKASSSLSFSRCPIEYKMPRTYVDNAYNRSRGRVGMPVGSFVISRSGTFLGSQEYVDNYKNRSLVRVGLPRGSYPEGCSSWDTLSDKVSVIFLQSNYKQYRGKE